MSITTSSSHYQAPGALPSGPASPRPAVSGNYESPWMTDELRAFRAAVRQFVNRELVPRRARTRDGAADDVAAAWAGAGALGMLLADVPQEYGGGGGTFAHQAVVLEELAAAGVELGLRLQSIVAHYLLAYGTEEQKRAWLPPMARGELTSAIAMTEPGAGSDLQAITTSARREGDRWVISGAKSFISNGSHAGLVCLAVKTDPHAAGPKGMSLLMVETAGLAGYKVGRPLEKLGLGGLDVCELFFDEARVPAASLLGPAEGKGFSQLMAQLPYERLTVAVGAVAAAEAAVALTTSYVKQRTAFGRPLIDLQNTRFRLAECRTEAHVGRVFLDSCIARQLERPLDAVTAAMAKYWLTECQWRILDACLQMHGGYGYTTEQTIARLWADSRAARIYAGSNEIMREVIGCSL